MISDTIFLSMPGPGWSFSHPRSSLLLASLPLHHDELRLLWLHTVDIE